MKKKPNVVIFNPDEMRWDTLGHMGVNPATITPYLDEFARTDAVSFSNAYCQNPVCCPSRCSFFTGLYPHVRGHRTMQYLLHPDESSLFSEMKNAGYYVWMNDRNDLLAGQIPGFVESHADVIYSAKDDPRVNGKFSGNPKNANIRGEIGDKFYYSHFIGELTTDEDGVCYNNDDSCVDECIKVLGSGVTDKPIVAFLGLFFPHCPYGVEEPYFSAIDRSKLPPRAKKGSGKAKMHDSLRERMALDKLEETDWDELRANYLGMCMKIDNQFKRLCEGMKANGTYDDSLIIVLSDHGDFAGDYDLSEKSQNTFEDCLTRVPFLIKPPKGYPVDPGVTSSLVELVDFYATVMDYADIKPDHDHFGISLRPIVENRNKEIKDYVYCEGGRMPYEIQADEYHGVCGKGGSIPRFSEYWPKQDAQTDGDAHIKGTMIRDKQYKYIKRANGKDEFYDLTRDPLEEINVIDDPGYHDQILKMRLEMLDWYQKTCDIVPKKIDNRIKYSSLVSMLQGLPETVQDDIIQEYNEGLSGLGLAMLIRKKQSLYTKT